MHKAVRGVINLTHNKLNSFITKTSLKDNFYLKSLSLKQITY